MPFCGATTRSSRSPTPRTCSAKAPPRSSRKTRTSPSLFISCSTPSTCRSRPPTYAAMLSAMDDNVGRVLAKLREHGLEENTLIFFLSDNGGPTLATTSRNDPLRGYKGQVLEGGIRIPYIIQWKGHLPAGTVCDQPVISLDIHPDRKSTRLNSSHANISYAVFC